MSIIVPAGNKNVSWSPKEETLVKTASAGAEVQEETNALYEAAKKYVEASSDCCKECKKPKGLCKCPKSDEKASSDKASSDAKSDDKSSSTKTAGSSEGLSVIEVGAPACGGSSDTSDGIGAPASDVVPASVEQAVEKVEEAVADLKDVVTEDKGGDVKEVEIEVEPELNIPGKEVSDSEIIVKSEPDMACACAEKKEISMNKAAATEEEFCRFAMLSSANRKKLSDYWVNMLGFPKDYVNLMTKDYEK